jgi:deoxyhypusine synthase
MNVAGVELRGNKLRVNPSIDVNETTAYRPGRQTRGRQERRGALGRRQPQELHAPDRAADPGSAAHQGIRPGLLPPGHRRPARHRRPERRHALSEAVSWGKVDPDRLPDAVVCYTDTTIAMPILTHYALAKHKPREPWAPSAANTSHTTRSR